MSLDVYAAVRRGARCTESELSGAVHNHVVAIVQANGLAAAVTAGCVPFGANASLTPFLHSLRCEFVGGPLPAPGSAAARLPKVRVVCFALYGPETFEEPLEDPDDITADVAGGGGGGAGSVPSFEATPMPNETTDGLWESLQFDADAAAGRSAKGDLLRYALTALQLSGRGVDPQLVSWNRMVLLHGPPGSGKTSLCRGLAHRLAIAVRKEFDHTHLVEINAHSLFSRWFSESGKQVMALFRRLREMLAVPRSLVCVLIDEVESLAAARTAAMSGNEPSDSIRVVNALLTQLDALRRHRNVLVLSTSNITGAIDIAFVDRADLRLFIAPPPTTAKARIVAAAVVELVEKGLVAPPVAAAPLPGGPSVPSAAAAAAAPAGASSLPAAESGGASTHSQAYAASGGAAAAGHWTKDLVTTLTALIDAAEAAANAAAPVAAPAAESAAAPTAKQASPPPQPPRVELSGRVLRKLPFLAFMVPGVPPPPAAGATPIPFDVYVRALRDAATFELKSREAAKGA